MYLCPACGNELDAVASVGHQSAPRVGDVTLCGKCGQLLQFGLAFKPSAIDDEEVRPGMDPEAWAMLWKLREVIRFMWRASEHFRQAMGDGDDKPTAH